MSTTSTTTNKGTGIVFKRSAYVDACRELNEALSLSPKIDLKKGMSVLRSKVREVLDLLEPGDVFTDMTTSLLEDVRAESLTDDVSVNEDDLPITTEPEPKKPVEDDTPAPEKAKKKTRKKKAVLVEDEATEAGEAPVSKGLIMAGGSRYCRRAGSRVGFFDNLIFPGIAADELIALAKKEFPTADEDSLRSRLKGHLRFLRKEGVTITVTDGFIAAAEETHPNPKAGWVVAE